MKIQDIPKWLLIIALVGILTGSASALFLISLDWVTNYRIAHFSIIYFLPFAGLLIGLLYYYWGQDVVKGNNKIKEEIYAPKEIIPFRMATLVLFSTLVTHLFGGSAGREGTAVQMGGAIADRMTHYFKLNDEERKLVLILGISAGFASVFNTPITGAIFALEVLALRKINFIAVLPSFLVAFLAQYICNLYPIQHTHYHIGLMPDFSFQNVGWIIFSAICFGLAALLFSQSVHFFGKTFQKIKYPPLRPFVGGIVLVLIIHFFEVQNYIGLGVPTIQNAFHEVLPEYSFILKIALTTFTLGCGFKGGEVTPLFFVGATLGNLLSLYIPLPMTFLAGIGFVSVFSGATNTPIACTIMGVELFGIDAAVYLAIGCFVAFLFSGKKGIYASQKMHWIKEGIATRLSRKTV